MKNTTLRLLVMLGVLLLGAYSLFFPDRGLNLGLDLRGGIYLELEVDLDDAMKKRLEFLASDFYRSIKDETFAAEKTEIIDSEKMAIVLKDPAHASAIKKKVEERYSGVWVFETRDGNRLLYQLEAAYREELNDQILAQSIESVRNRVDRYGVAEASINRYGEDKIVVELPGTGDPDRVISVIRQTGQLEFKLVNDEKSEEELKVLIAEARQQATLPETYDKATVERLTDLLKDQLPENSEIAFELSRDPATKKITGGTPYLLNKKSELTGEFLEDARVSVYNNEPQVSLSFNQSGTKLFADLTRANVGKRLAIILDGNIAAAPQVREEIPNGQAQITLGYGDYQTLLREAEDLALVLREGALPASIYITKRNVIGPSLGADSIRKGVTASIIGGVLVILFMLFYYRASGAVADLSLVLNIILLLSVLSLLQASLTLPGIAGIALTIGMAVDANVVIFERIKDELEAGFAVKPALERGYANAVRAVLDANITTFISGVVLYQFGTGPIKGFATTLMIGIGSTLLTAVVFSRWIQEFLLARHKWSRISL